MSEVQAAPVRRGGFGAALAGGIIGSLLTAGLLVFAAPSLIAPKIVRQGLLADPTVLPEAIDALAAGNPLGMSGASPRGFACRERHG